MYVEHLAPLVPIHELEQCLNEMGAKGFGLVAACPEVIHSPGASSTDQVTMLYGYRLFFIRPDLTADIDSKGFARLFNGLIEALPNFTGPGFDPARLKHPKSGPSEPAKGPEASEKQEQAKEEE